MKCVIRSKKNINANIMKAQICHTIKYTLKGRERLNKALIAKFFLAVIYQLFLTKISMNVNIMKTQFFFYKMKYVT